MLILIFINLPTFTPLKANEGLSNVLLSNMTELREIFVKSDLWITLHKDKPPFLRVDVHEGWIREGYIIEVWFKEVWMLGGPLFQRVNIKRVDKERTIIKVDICKNGSFFDFNFLLFRTLNDLLCKNFILIKSRFLKYRHRKLLTLQKSHRLKNLQ